MLSNKRLLRSLAVVACAVTVTTTIAAAAGCTDDTAIRVTGRVADDVVIVQAPALTAPRPNPDAGFPAAMSPGTLARAAPRSGVSTIAAVTGVGSVSRINSVAVALGDSVDAGDVIAEFDTAALDVALEAARADERVAHAQVDVLADAIDEADSAESTLAAKRRTIRDTITQLTSAREQLAGRLVQLRAMSSVGANASLPATSTTSTPPGARPGTPTPAQLRETIAQLEASIVKIDAGLTKARQGLSRLTSARSTLADARTQLRNLLSVARVTADASSIGVRAAEYQRSLAVLRAPVDGVILQIADVGDVLAPGAAVARVREPVATRVLTWLPPEDLQRTAEGDRVRITGDWFSSDAPVRGRITRIGKRADYPPTAFATKDVHMTRAVPVEITVDHTPAGGGPSSGSLPPGTPVDVTILPRSATQH